MNILIAGGAGFIGSHFVRMLCSGKFFSTENQFKLFIIDSLGYAGRYENIEEFIDNKRVIFIKEDINNISTSLEIPKNLDVVFNFAAQTHVDNSITSPGEFIRSNVSGMHSLLYFAFINFTKTFIQVSTDEVYGSISEGSATEKSSLNPSSPYSASKAAADLIALSYFKTFKFDTRITRCSNNYGARQYPEKLIPFFVKCIIENKNLPIYGSGLQVRDWIHVEDHCRAIWLTFLKGSPGNIYNFGGNREIRNIDLAQKIINLAGSKVEIEYVEDRKGHDFRYSVNDQKARNELNFATEIDFEVGLLDTISWYLSNKSWIETTNKYKAENRS